MNVPAFPLPGRGQTRFLAERYERRSLLISSHLVFSQWDQILKEPMTTMAAINRLAHHGIILEFDGTSLRAKKTPEKAENSAAPESKDSPAAPPHGRTRSAQPAPSQ